MNSASWHYRFTFSLWISNEFCVQAPQIRDFGADFYITNSAFWHNRFAFSLQISNEFYVLALQIRIFIADV